MLRPLFATLTVFSMQVAFAQTPEVVAFDSADGDVKLTGFLYLPDFKEWPGLRPAVVMLHGRSGVFSSNAKNLMPPLFRPAQ